MKWWDRTYYYIFDNIELWINLGVSLLIFFAFLVLRKLFVKYILSLIMRFTDKTKTDLDRKILVSFEKPLQLFIVIIGIYLALRHSSLYITNIFSFARFDLFLSRFLRSFVIVFFTWGLYNLEATSSVLFQFVQKSLDIRIDKLLIPFLSKVLRVLTIALAISIIAQEWGYDVNGFIAGLGLGGLAFALAAKDTVANVFGGIVIIMDKPFSIDDWIKTPSVEGVVEDINFRSTKIRTFDQALVTVPNSSLANDNIINWSKMGKRRITFNLGVMYSTTKEQLEKCIKDIRAMLREHPDVHDETIVVTFDKYNDSSLDIFLYFFTKTTVWLEYLMVKENINFRILEILEKNDVAVAFPSQSVYLETPLNVIGSTEKPN